MRGTRGARVCLAIAAALAAIACTMALAGQAAASQVSLTGTLESAHTDYFSKGESGPTRYYLQTRSGKRHRLQPRRSITQHVGDHASITGTSDNGTVSVNSADFSEGQPVADAPGARKVAVILFNFENQATEPWTQAEARSYIFTGASSVSEYFKEASSNTLSLTGKNNTNGDVFGYYTIPYSSTGSCSWTTWAAKARAMAEAAGNNMTGYDHYLYASPNTTACSFGGVAYMPGSVAYLDGSLASLRTASHELSHNLGIHHSATMNCGDDPLPLTYTDYSNGSAPAGCTYGEYGDPFDLMGAAYSYHPSNQHKGDLEQKTGANFLTGTTQTVASNGIYTLEPSEPGFTGTQVLRIPRTNTPSQNTYSYYYLDYRRPYGTLFETFSPSSAAASGVTIRTAGGYGSYLQTRLIDATPPNNFTNAPLPAGSSYTFPDTGVTIKTLSVSSSGAQVQVGDISGMAAVSGSELSYLAPAGSANDVTVSSSGSVHTLTDRGVASVPAGNGCQATADPRTVTCSGSGITKAKVELRDGNDAATGAGSDLDLTIDGGDGIDSLTGGTGDDVLRGGFDADTMHGGLGADRADYSDHQKNIKVDLDGAAADDGQAGENDTIDNDIEDVTGGLGADRLIGSDAANLLDGGPGNDRVYGAAKPSNPDAADEIVGGDGLDKLYGRGGDDLIHGGPGKDVLFGEAGTDLLHGDEDRNTVFGGNGDDTLFSIADPGGYGENLKGGEGNDTFNTADGDDRDKIGCGNGSDTANKDQFDSVSATQCESIR